MRIEIAGVIASGKTTLATLLQSRLSGSALLERFHENPFFDAFYRDPARFAFETELTFLLQHYHSVLNASATTDLRFCDFAFVLDLAYASVTLPERRLQIFRDVWRELIAALGEPSLLIHLKCPAQVALSRVRARGRAAEDSITTEYIHNVATILDTAIGETRAHKITIDSALIDFAHDEVQRAATVSLVIDAIATVNATDGATPLCL